FFDLWSEQNIKITHPTKGLIPWKMYPYMKRITEAIEDSRFVIVNKFRQSGITTMTLAHALWDAIWHTDQKILFLTNYDRCACELSRIMRRMISHLPEQPHLGV